MARSQEEGVTWQSDIELIVLGFQSPQFHGEIIAELERLRAERTPCG